MHFYKFPLASFAILSSSVTIAAPTLSSQRPPGRSITTGNFNSARSDRVLRVDDTASIDASGFASKSSGSEERGIFSSIKADIKSWAKMKHWVHAEKSDDYVKKSLKMDDLSRAALLSHPNYNTFKKFLYKKEGKMLDDWVSQETDADKIWIIYGLNKLSEKQLANNGNYKLYTRYVAKYDDKLFKNGDSFMEPTIFYGGSDAEMKVKVAVWAAKDLPKFYVRKMMEMRKRIPEREILAHKNYGYYKAFRKR